MNLFRGNESGRGRSGGAVAGAEAGALYRAASPRESGIGVVPGSAGHAPILVLRKFWLDLDFGLL